MIPLAILCGGQATRLYPLTKTQPKSMVKICGEPFIHHQLVLARTNGIKGVVLCTGKFSDKIKEFVGDGSQYGLDVKYSEDGDEPLGTGGALKKALPLLDDYFFVMYGDSYLDTNWKDVFVRYATHPCPVQITFYNGVDYGLNIIEKEYLDNFSKQAFDIWEFYDTHERWKNIYKMDIKKPFHEIGSINGIKELERYLCNTS